MSTKPIFAVITAYFKEPFEVIQRAINSVKNMDPDGFEIRHYLIADGHPQKSLAESNQFHFTLNQSHSDFGDTPRLVGSMIAIREGASGIMFLDADNVIYRDHLILCKQKYINSDTNIVLTKRDWLHVNGSILNYKSDEDENYSHVDTGCFTFFDEAVFEIFKWALIPKELSSFGDRYFWHLLRANRTSFAATQQSTIGYTCMWRDVYEKAGVDIPEQVPYQKLDMSFQKKFFDSLSDNKKNEIRNRLKLI
jgi:hypothetical protein